MHDLDRTRVAPGAAFDVPDAREHEDAAPANDREQNDFGHAEGAPDEAPRLALAMRLLDAAEGALEIARLAADATRRGAEAPPAVAPATQVAPGDAGKGGVRAVDLGSVDLGSTDLGGLGRSGRWVRRGQRIILLGA